MKQNQEKRFARLWLGAIVVAGLLLGVSVASQPVVAASNAVRQYLIGTGFLCDLAPTACPAVTKGDGGDRIEITGQGTLQPSANKATGGGTFVHKHGSKVVGQGTWTATSLVSFISYGTSPEVLPANFEGGLSVMTVHLTSADGSVQFDGVLTVDCLIGSVPAGAEEGVTLTIPGVIDFDDIVSGFTLFLLPG